MIVTRHGFGYSIFLSVAFVLNVGCGGGGGSSDNSSGKFTIDACSAIGAKIFGGTECPLSGSTKSPLARLEIVTGDGQVALCSGTVIRADAVLTAAHCVADASSIQVDAGGSRIAAKAIAIHPDAVANTQLQAVFNDVAIVYTSRALNATTAPILISRSVRVGEESVVAGFGQEESGKIGVIQAGNAFITSVTENHIGTAYDGSGSNPCFGDSGGPLFISVGGTLAVAGVVSSGKPEKNCAVGDVTLYANLDNATINQFILQSVPGTATR